MYNAYTGIGSRETPKEALDIFTQIAEVLDILGYKLRSGGADGADTAFELGSSDKEIYIPWAGFNKSTSRYHNVSDEALHMASKYHPYWDKCSPGAKKLHARNCYQVLGYDLKTPTSFIICYTKGGKGGGGTGQALRVAKDHNIKIFDAGGYDDLGYFYDEVCKYAEENLKK